MNIMFQNILAQGGIHCICVLYALLNLFHAFFLAFVFQILNVADVNVDKPLTTFLFITIAQLHRRW